MRTWRWGLCSWQGTGFLPASAFYMTATCSSKKIISLHAPQDAFGLNARQALLAHHCRIELYPHVKGMSITLHLSGPCQSLTHCEQLRLKMSCTYHICDLQILVNTTCIFNWNHQGKLDQFVLQPLIGFGVVTQPHY